MKRERLEFPKGWKPVQESELEESVGLECLGLTMLDRQLPLMILKLTTMSSSLVHISYSVSEYTPVIDSNACD